MLKSGADVNFRFSSLNTTALMTTSFHGHVDILQMLLDAGADVTALDLQKSTALGYAFGGS
jgi:ankyrin repeat protein